MPQENALRPWKTERFCIPSADRPRFVAAMEEILDAYHARHPLIGMDETARQLLSDVLDPLPLRPGRPRRVGCRDRRTGCDWVREVRHLLEVDYPVAEVVTVVCDNRNTHHVASLYKAFDAGTAGRLRSLPTPVNGSWLNMAEAELGVRSRQCLGSRRFGTRGEMEAVLDAWSAARNTTRAGMRWRFTTVDARIKLKSLYPLPDINR